MDSWQQYKDNFKTRGAIWTLGHFVYESSLARRLISPLVNLFKPDWVQIGNNKMYIDKNDRVVSQSLISFGTWEEFETDIFRKNIRPGDIVLDVGANIGYHTLIAAELVGTNGKVYAFEPDKRNFALLKKNVEANGYKNVVLVPKALADKNKKAKLFLTNEENFGDLRVYDSKDGRKSVEIEMITLDSIVKTKVDVIKIDVQGAEVLVLKGAKKTLAKSKKLKLFTEFWPKALKLAGSSAKEYLDILNANRFEIWELQSDNRKIKKILPNKLMTDYPESSIYNADLLCIK